MGKGTTNLINDCLAHRCTDERMRLIILILQDYNCRISEVLEAEWSNVITNNCFILKGKKGSEDIIIRDRTLISCILNLTRFHRKFIFYPVTYHNVYLFIKRNFPSLVNSIRRRKYKAVTHAFRYPASVLVEDENTTKVILHHKSLKSQVYYKNRAKK